MKTYRATFRQVRSRLNFYSRLVKMGHKITIYKENVPIAEMRPIPPSKPSRNMGAMKDWVFHCAINFNDPLSEIEEAVEASPFPHSYETP